MRAHTRRLGRRGAGGGARRYGGHVATPADFYDVLGLDRRPTRAPSRAPTSRWCASIRPRRVPRSSSASARPTRCSPIRSRAPTTTPCDQVGAATAARLRSAGRRDGGRRLGARQAELTRARRRAAAAAASPGTSSAWRYSPRTPPCRRAPRVRPLVPSSRATPSITCTRATRTTRRASTRRRSIVIARRAGSNPNDARALVAAADCLVAQKDYEPALPSSTAPFVSTGGRLRGLRLLHAQGADRAVRERGNLAEAGARPDWCDLLPDDSGQRASTWPRDSASLASDLFAMKRSADANRLLARCGALDPARVAMAYTFPPRVPLRIAALPARVAGVAGDDRAGRLAADLAQERDAAPAAFPVAPGDGLGVVGSTPVSTRGRAWDGGQTGAGTFWSSPAHRWSSPARWPMVACACTAAGTVKLTTIHPCHLLQVDVDK